MQGDKTGPKSEKKEHLPAVSSINSKHVSHNNAKDLIIQEIILLNVVFFNMSCTYLLARNKNK